MKFPSILKIPRHQRFHFQPRYYDPVKDDLDQRVSRIKKELEQGGDGKGDYSYRDRITKSFSRRSIGQRKTKSKTGLIQFSIMIILAVGFFGYIYFGDIALYFFLLLTALYIYLRLRRIF